MDYYPESVSDLPIIKILETHPCTDEELKKFNQVPKSFKEFWPAIRPFMMCIESNAIRIQNDSGVNFARSKPYINFIIPESKCRNGPYDS